MLLSSAATAGGRAGAAVRGRGPLRRPLSVLAAAWPSHYVSRPHPRSRRRRGPVTVVAAAATAAGAGRGGGDSTTTAATAGLLLDAAAAAPAETAAALPPRSSGSGHDSSLVVAVPPPYPSSPPSSSPPAWAPVLAAALVGAAVGVAGAWAALGRKRKSDSDVEAAKQQQAAVAPPPPPPAAAPAASGGDAAAAPPPPQTPTTRPRRPAGVSDAMRWYRRLPRVHYLEASRDNGPVTRIAASELGPDVSEALRLDAAGGAVALLGFQDPADAEFALACMGKKDGKGVGGVALASAGPVELEAKLKAGQALFVLPSGRLPIKVVSSEAGLKQLLKIALLQDVADRAGAVIPAAPAAEAATPAAAVEVAVEVEEAPVTAAAEAAPAAVQAPAPQPPPPPAPRAPQPQAAPPKPPPPAPAAAAAPPAAPASPTRIEADDEEDEPFAPVTFAPAQPPPRVADPAADRRLLDDYYALEQAWAADRVANVASAARAQIDDALRSIDSKVDQSIDDRSVDRQSIDEEEESRSIDRESPDRSTSSRSASTKPSASSADADDDSTTTKSTVVSKGTRKKRPGEEAPPKLSPEQLQRSVLEAMKEIDPSRDDRDKKGDSTTSKPLIGEIDDDDLTNSKWWKKRFRALFLPTVHSGGVAGFLQVDISSDGTAKDVRVVCFEDRYDAMACIATMAEIDAFKATGATFSVGALPTDKVEQELREAYLRQRAEGGTASAPAGVLVFRRGKLPLKVGMSEEEFVRAIVLQGTAQTSLLMSGFQF